MKIEVKLDSPKYCDGCPMLAEEYQSCDYYGELVPRENHMEYGKSIRPEVCITENGE